MNLATCRHRPIKNLLFANFTTDANYIFIGKKNGFSIFRLVDCILEPIMEIQNIPEYPQFRITSMDILQNSNLLAILIGNSRPPFDGTHVLIWDAQSRMILHDISFDCGIHAVRIVPERLIVILMSKIVVYSLTDGKIAKMQEYEMYWNECSVIGLSNVKAPYILAFPAKNKGQVHCVDITPNNNDKNIAHGFSTILAGHNGAINAIAVSDDGQMVATASTNGTLIRVWKTRTGNLMNEFRRGVEYAQVYSLEIDPYQTKLAVISEKQTLHFFNIETTSNLKNLNSKTAKYLPKYFNSDWSIDKISVPSIEKCILKFQTIENTTEEDPKVILYMLAADATLRSIELDPNRQNSVKEGIYLKFKV